MALDPIGLVVRDLRANAAVAAITTRIAGGDFDPKWSENGADPRPCVVVVGSGRSRSPWGAGSSRLGLQDQLVITRCYGGGGDGNDERPAIVSSAQLRGLVEDALHNKGIRRFESGRRIYQSDSLSGGGPSVDPDTRWRYETATFHVVAPAQAVA
jgi:hypothetical protein